MRESIVFKRELLSYQTRYSLHFIAESCVGGRNMETNEKIFRYSQIKSLGVLYLMFLVLCVIGGLIVGIREVMYFALLIGIGVILLILFLTTSVAISDTGITTRNLLGKKSLQWSDIRQVSSKGSSIKLHNRDHSISLSISPRLDHSVEIFDLIYSKRPDLFSIKKNNQFLRSYRDNLISMVLGLLLIILSVILYFYNQYSFITGALGLLLCARSLYGWYSSPRWVTLENDCLIANYINRSYSISANDIAAIQIEKTKQNQFRSVAVVFRDTNTMEISGFKQSPFIIYAVLRKWHQMYAKKEQAIPARA